MGIVPSSWTLTQTSDFQVVLIIYPSLPALWEGFYDAVPGHVV